MDPGLQDEGEIKRLLKQNLAFEQAKKDQLRLRAGIAGAPTRCKLALQLKEALKNNKLFEMDNDPFMSRFKSQYIDVSDRLELSGAYKMTNNTKSFTNIYSATSKYQKVPDIPVEIPQL